MAALLGPVIRADFQGRQLFIWAFKEGQGFLSGARGKIQGDQQGRRSKGVSYTGMRGEVCQAEASVCAKVLGWEGGKCGWSTGRQKARVTGNGAPELAGYRVTLVLDSQHKEPIFYLKRDGEP